MSEINGQTSDGCHTFDELYDHRTVLFALVLDELRKKGTCVLWKSRLHADGTMYDGFFIAGVTTPDGQATYHCKDEYWHMFKLPRLDQAPAFDGHTPDDTLLRLSRALAGAWG